MTILFPFSESSFGRRHFIDVLIKQSTGPFSSPFSRPKNVLLRDWDRIYTRTWCEVGTGDVKFLFVCLVSVCVSVSADHWTVEQSFPDGKPFSVLALSAQNHGRGGSPLGVYF